MISFWNFWCIACIALVSALLASAREELMRDAMRRLRDQTQKSQQMFEQKLPEIINNKHCQEVPVPVPYWNSVAVHGYKKPAVHNRKKTIHPGQSLMSDGRRVLGFITTCTQSSFWNCCAMASFAWHEMNETWPGNLETRDDKLYNVIYKLLSVVGTFRHIWSWIAFYSVGSWNVGNGQFFDFYSDSIFPKRGYCNLECRPSELRWCLVRPDSGRIHVCNAQRIWVSRKRRSMFGGTSKESAAIAGLVQPGCSCHDSLFVFFCIPRNH